MKRKKLLEIIDSSVYGGAEKSTFLISREFLRKGYDVYLVFPPGDYAEKFHSLRKEGAHTIELPIRTDFIKSLCMLKSILKKEDIHYIHSHQIRADLLVVIASSLLPRRKIRIVSSVHCFIKYDVSNPIKRYMYFLFSYISYHMVDFIVVVSSALKNEIVSYYFLKKERVFIALNSISFDEITTNHTNQKEIINKYDIDRKDTVIVCVGELSHRKGQLSLLHAFTQLDELSVTKLILLGDGILYNKLIKMVKEKQLSTCVIIPGYKKDIYDWISLATIYVQPSRYDPLPRAMLEAMYLGKPVIASDIPTMKDVIQHGTTGLLTETTPEKLKNAIEFLISNNELRKEISHKGQQFVLQHCSIKTMSDRIEDILISYNESNHMQ